MRPLGALLGFLNRGKSGGANSGPPIGGRTIVSVGPLWLRFGAFGALLRPSRGPRGTSEAKLRECSATASYPPKC
eukprot:1585370-Pyramimonas_sp.AAC.1